MAEFVEFCKVYHINFVYFQITLADQMHFDELQLSLCCRDGDQTKPTLKQNRLLFYL